MLDLEAKNKLTDEYSLVNQWTEERLGTAFVTAQFEIHGIKLYLKMKGRLPYVSAKYDSFQHIFVLVLSGLK